MPKVVSSQKTKVKKAAMKIPYARGYQPPSPEEQIKAIGFKPTILPLEYSDVSQTASKFFTPIPEPSSIDDWLAQYVEEGQTFRRSVLNLSQRIDKFKIQKGEEIWDQSKEYLRENPWFSRRKQKFMRQTFVPDGKTLCEKYPDGKVYIAKIGEFSSNEISFEELIDYIRKFLCVPVQILEGLDIENRRNDLIFVENPAFNPSSRPGARIKKSLLHTRYNDKTKHIQIGVDSILPKLHTIIPNDALCLVGLTPYDLYGDEPDLFVAGMASGSRRVAIFSLLRYNPALTFSQEHWYDIKDNKSVDPSDKRRLILHRSCKLVVHEICHLLGLPHCVYYRCCMNGSGHLQEDFDQPMMLCPVDLHKLQVLIGFDVVTRYQGLLEFYKKHGFTEEANWVERRLQFLKSHTVSSISTTV